MNRKIKEILNKNLYRPSWYSIVINPYFIVRRNLLSIMVDFTNDDFTGKNILDVGCGIKPYESLFLGSSYIGIDIQGGGHKDEEKKPNKFYDGSHIPFDNNCFSYVISTEVLEHVFDPQKLLSEMARVLKPGGSILVTMPFVWPEHEIPFDSQRFTRYKLLQIFKEVGFVDITISERAGVFRVCGQLISAFIFERLFPKNKLLKSISAILLCFPIQVFFIIFDMVFKNTWIALNYSVKAKKPL